MTGRHIVRASIISVGCTALAISAVWWLYRPWALTWGATEDEVDRAMPGDQIVREATFCATRAVTVNAPPERVWPWIKQIGYRRAGFYSYDFLDNDGVPSATGILTQYQILDVGDAIPLSSGALARVVELVPNSLMVLVFETSGVWDGSTWVWCLEPIGGLRTRLVTRLRVRTGSRLSRVVLDLGEIVMMRKCLLGIKRRAEAESSQPPEGG